MITNLNKLTGSAPLYRRLASQTNPQDAFVEIDPSGAVWYYSDPEIGNGVPIDVFNCVARRWRIPHVLTAQGYQSLHEDIEDMLQRIADGMDTYWDGRNTVGCLSEDASDARDELEQFINNIWQNDYHRDEEYLSELESA